MFDLAPAEKAKWAKAAMGVVAKWINTMEGKGLAGKKVYELARTLRDKFLKGK